MSDEPRDQRQSRRETKQRRLNRDMLFKLVLVVFVMAGFGYAMVPMYKSICEALGVNVRSTRRSTSRAT
jgi:cytochrome c oxidase assembly protein subunit 11